MIIKRLIITPIGLYKHKEVYIDLNAITAGNLIKGRLNSARGYDTKIPKPALVRHIGKNLINRFGINPETLVLPSEKRFVYNM